MEAWGEDRWYLGAFTSRRVWAGWWQACSRAHEPSPEAWWGATAVGWALSICSLPLISHGSKFIIWELFPHTCTSQHLSPCGLQEARARALQCGLVFQLETGEVRWFEWRSHKRFLHPALDLEESFLWKRGLYRVKMRSFWVAEGP